jgi:hypothetical protein
MKDEVPKYYQDGKVAVIINGRYGGGWTSWDDSTPKTERKLFDPDIVRAILAKNYPLIKDLAISKYGMTCFQEWNAESLRVVFLDKGEHFFIKDHDGKEYIEEYYIPPEIWKA